jgi:DEAD/DEAH box helicase domain-containing protein
MRNINTPQGELRDLIQRWKSGKGAGRHFTAIEHIPAREADYADFPERLNPGLKQMLQKRGIDRLYSHQSQAIEHALDREDVVVVTPTASGKSLCYNLPVLDAMYRNASALYLFPTKALSQDQTAELNQLLGAAPGTNGAWEAQVYDGDTPPDVRRRIRRNGRLVVTNPDMLHAGILPHHEKWANFFRSLEYVVIDEIHTYRGVFGSHVANVMRRLNRVCAHYGTKPTFVATSATIANPKELATALGDRPFELVDNNGAPSSERYVCFFNPPIVDPQQMRRQSPLTAAERIAKKTIKKGCGTIVFARSRQSVEVVVHRLKDRLARDRGNKNLQDRIASYRGGYLPDLRRSIERGLREGYLLGVISTNALELGIDIGSLDVCILAGYPGSVASTWQQIGRAGRSGGLTLAVVVAGDAPVDQFIIGHPEYFIGQSPEEARIDPRNLLIAVEHLKCAAYELGFKVGEGFGDLSPTETEEALEFLEAETNMVRRVDGRWKWSSETYPASEINLRNIAEENFVVIDITHNRSNVVAEVDFEGAHTALYPNAVYQISGEPFRVERLDYDERRAYVRRSDDGYYTTAMHYASVHVLDVFKESEAPPGRIGFGEVRVTDRFVGYKKIKFGTGENVGYGEINLPELDLHTMAYWLELPTDNFPDLSADPERWARLVHGAGKVLQTAASLRLMCDPRDLDLCIGSVADDRWLSEGFDGLTLRDTDGKSHSFSEDEHEADPDNAASFHDQHHEMQTGRIGPVLYDPTIFIYDKYPGGVGFGEGLFDNHRDFVKKARELIEDCACERGCPSCVGPPHESRGETKTAVSQLLGRLAYIT